MTSDSIEYRFVTSFIYVGIALFILLLVYRIMAKDEGMKKIDSIMESRAFKFFIAPLINAFIRSWFCFVLLFVTALINWHLDTDYYLLISSIIIINLSISLSELVKEIYGDQFTASFAGGKFKFSYLEFLIEVIISTSVLGLIIIISSWTMVELFHVATTAIVFIIVGQALSSLIASKMGS